MTPPANATAPVVVVLPKLDNTLGAVFIGTYLSLILFGLAIHQAYRYYATYPEDKLWLKIYVAAVLICETACTFCCCHICYFYSVTNYDNPATLNYVTWSASMLAVIGSITVVVSQFFFMYRVWRLGRQNRPVVIVAAIFLLLELSVCFVTAVDGFRLKEWTEVFKRLWLISIHNAASAVADFLTTVVLIRALHASRTGVTRTDSMINVLIMYAVSTGLLTGIYNIVSFAFTISDPTNFIYNSVIIVGIKLYSNSLLAALNSRRSVSERHMVGFTDTSPFGVTVRRDSMSFRSAPPAQASRGLSSGTADSTLDGDAMEFKAVKGSSFNAESSAGTFSVHVG